MTLDRLSLEDRAILTRSRRRQLEAALVHYAYCRAHSALGGRVPAELYFGVHNQRPLLNSAPRGRPDEPEMERPVAIVFLDPDTATSSTP